MTSQPAPQISPSLSHIFAQTACLLGLLLVTTISLFIVRAPAPDASHPFNTDAAFERLVRILGDETPHPIDTDANDAVRDRLVQEIEKLGFEPIIRDSFHCTNYFGGICARIRNVMFWAVPPSDDTTKGVAVVSHYDSVPAGPGASDDGAGVAISLEIARLLKGRDLPRPVLVIMTDGEEAGLLGAESFVYNDPLAARIGSVVNLEARGVSGPASMFQTSTPNGFDIAAIPKWGRTALTNTLSSDIYEAMPNDTDLSRFLDVTAPRSVNATNYAFILGESFYHTPGDNLSNLDKASLFHMGVNALSTVEKFAIQSDFDTLVDKSEARAEPQRIYFDLATRGVISLPSWTGITAILSTLLLSAAALTIRSEWRGWRGWLIFPAAFITAGIAAYAAGWVIDFMRDGAAYAPAHPWALRGASSAAAILAAFLVAFALTPKPATKADVGPLLKSWVWVAVLSLLAWQVFPGSVVIFVGMLIIATLAGLAALAGQAKLCRGLSLLAALIFVLVNLPLPGFALAALGGLATPFAALWAIPPLILLLAYPLRARRAIPLTGLSLATVGLFIGALIVPAHTAKAPKGLSLHHVASEAGNFIQITGRAAPPKSLSESGSFTFDNPTEARIPRYAGDRWTRSTPHSPDIDVDILVNRDEVIGTSRRISLQIIAPTADRLHLAPASPAALWTSLSVNGVAVTPSRWGLRLPGRDAQNVAIDIELPATAPLGEVAVIRYGVGEAIAPLTDQRPDWALPKHDGDLRIRFVDLDTAQTPVTTDVDPDE